jgi:putative membrane protein
MWEPWDPAWRRGGREPDYRFTLANERTFLAWIRTGLALMAAGLLLAQFANHTRMPRLAVAAGTGLVAFAAALAWIAYRRWRANEIAMRHEAPLPAGRVLPWTAAVLAALAVCMVTLALHG